MSAGADHIFIGALIGWGSEHMQRLLRILAPFVDEGALSVVSHAGDGFDKVRASFFLSFLPFVDPIPGPYLGTTWAPIYLGPCLAHF